MQDAKSVITQAAKGFVEDLAKRREITETRMYEILGKDNPYPKAKLLIRDIAQVNPHGARLIKADMNALFADILPQSATENYTVKDLNKEAFEAIDALLADKSAADRKKELRELIAVAEQMIEGIDKLDQQ